MTDLEERVREAVEKVVDPETRMTLGQMRLIRGVKEEEPGVVKVDFVPSSPFCPIAFKLAMDVKKAAAKVDGVKKAFVHCHGHIMEKDINRMVNE